MGFRSCRVLLVGQVFSSCRHVPCLYSSSLSHTENIVSSKSADQQTRKCPYRNMQIRFVTVHLQHHFHLVHASGCGSPIDDTMVLHWHVGDPQWVPRKDNWPRGPFPRNVVMRCMPCRIRYPCRLSINITVDKQSSLSRATVPNEAQQARRRKSWDTKAHRIVYGRRSVYMRALPW